MKIQSNSNLKNWELNRLKNWKCISCVRYGIDCVAKLERHRNNLTICNDYKKREQVNEK